MAPIYERITILFVDVHYLYVALGAAFAAAFLTIGVKRVDSQAIGSMGFGILIFPGTVAFWALLLRRWIAGENEPPDERNPHQ